MAVPLQAKNRVIGLIYVDAKSRESEFTAEHLNLLAVMANVAAIRIEHTRLAQIEEAQRNTHRELKQAAEIQALVLPDNAPCVPGIDLAGFNAPCYEVGGDYYTFIPYPGDQVAIALGDVAGKGMPASLMMMALHARVRVLAEQGGDLAAFMGRLNKATAEDCPENRFITFFYCVLDPANDELVYANAGHNSPIVIRKSGEVVLLENSGLGLGILPVVKYTQARTQFCPGDMLVVYSDGVTEATDPTSVLFGEERLLKVLQAHRAESAHQVVQAVTQALTEYAAEGPQADDITLVVAKRTWEPDGK